MLPRGPLPFLNECSSCPLVGPNGKPTAPVRGIGPEKPKFIILGESPGRNEIRESQPFIGDSGQLLMKALASVGVKRDEVWITNSVLCQPPSSGKDSIMAKATECCRPRLLRELADRELPTLYVLALGKYATQVFLGDEFKITELAGSYHEVELPNKVQVRLIPSIHPAAILRGGGGEGDAGAHAQDLLFWNLIYDAGKVAALAVGKVTPFSEDIETETINPKRAEYLIEGICHEVRKVGFVAIDTETRGVKKEECRECLNCNGHSALEAWHAKLIAIGLSTEAHAVSIVWAIANERTREMVRRLFADPKITKVFHNRSYDEIVLSRNGFPLAGRIDCTLLSHHSAFPGLSHKLQRVSTQFFVTPPWKCLRGDVAVFLPDRSTMNIKDVVEHQVPEVLSFDGNQIVTKRVLGWHDVIVPGGQEWIRIRTDRCDQKFNHGLIVTPDHRVMTERGLIEARDLKVEQDRILINEPKFSDDQIDAILGTLLGDSSLHVSRTYHNRPWMANRASVRGGHANEGLRDCKVAALPLGTTGQRLPAHLKRGTGGKTFRASDFFAYGTYWAFQYMALADFIYDGDWRRRIKSKTLKLLRRRGLAMMYMDDGNLHLRPNVRHRPSAGFATCGFPLEDVELFAEWLRIQYSGNVSVYKNGYCSLSVTATANMLEDLRGYIHPSVKYKTTFDDPYISVIQGQGVHSLPIRSVMYDVVNDYNTDRGKHLANHRYCLTVEDTGLFYTSYGLVSNSEFRHGKGSLRELTAYNAKDTLFCARLKSTIGSCVKKSNAEKTYEIDLKKAEIAAKMQMDGIPIDLTVNTELEKRFVPIVAGVYKELEEKLADKEVRELFRNALATEQAKRARKKDSPDFHARHVARLNEFDDEFEGLNLNAKDQVVGLLKACGVRLMSVTPKGSTTTKREVLEAINHPVVKALLRFRDYEHLKNTFIEPIPAMLDRQFRAHPEWYATAITGRFRSSPNCQNWSKGKTEAKSFTEWVQLYDTKGWQVAGLPNLRWQVVAPEGRIFVGGDAMQLEARVVALLSGDPYFCNAFNQEIDLHSEFAKVIFGAEFHGKGHCARCKLIRDVTKSCEYGWLYGGSVMTVWKQVVKEGFDIPIRKIAEMFQIFRQRAPRIEHFHSGLYRQVLEKGELRSFLNGRRRVFLLGAEETVVNNFPIQSSAADIVDTAMIQLDERLGPGDRIILQGHDMLGIETDEDRGEKVAEILKSCMDQEYTINGVSMRFPSEVAVGKDWSSI